MRRELEQEIVGQFEHLGFDPSKYAADFLEGLNALGNDATDLAEKDEPRDVEALTGADALADAREESPAPKKGKSMMKSIFQGKTSRRISRVTSAPSPADSAALRLVHQQD